jgi:hypothetical protein
LPDGDPLALQGLLYQRRDRHACPAIIHGDLKMRLLVVVALAAVGLTAAACGKKEDKEVPKAETTAVESGAVNAEDPGMPPEESPPDAR